MAIHRALLDSMSSAHPPFPSWTSAASGGGPWCWSRVATTSSCRTWRRRQVLEIRTNQNFVALLVCWNLCVPLFATIVLRFATTDALICYILFHEDTEDRDYVFLAATIVNFCYYRRSPELDQKLFLSVSVIFVASGFQFCYDRR
ncbi:hypothetical protein TRIUR3_16954 [Triticum urartu]|uniref:Uncharacterized protein n=1 Tax=Triticum urartu TaxID=4572 RepID=M7ZYW4_TRIUA|nr:hypothetical protein TRIUR3_16954 [Triticum urartu]